MGLVDPRVGLSGCRILLVRLVGSRPVRGGGSCQWVCDSCLFGVSAYETCWLY